MRHILGVCKALIRIRNLAEWTGLEPATPGVTGRYSNQLNYHSDGLRWWVLRGSNPRPSPCKGDALPAELSTQIVVLWDARYFTASLSALPGLKPGTFAALISMAAPVCGLRPARAARLRTTKVPNPTRLTCSSFFSDAQMLSKTASTARVAEALVMSAASATASTSSALFMELIPLIPAR